MIVTSFLSGIVVTTFLASGLFFHKFWRASRDRFFLFFAAACCLMALDPIIARLADVPQGPLLTTATETTSWVYLVRLLAFVVILVGVVDKNRSRR